MSIPDEVGKWGLAVCAAGWLLTVPVFVVFLYRANRGRWQWREFWLGMAFLPISWLAFLTAFPLIYVHRWHADRQVARGRLPTDGAGLR